MKQNTSIPMTMDDGTVVLWEISSSPSTPTQPQARGIQETIKGSFSHVQKTVKAVAHDLNQVYQEVRPDRLTVDFGLEMDFEPQEGTFVSKIVKGTGNANLHITIEWAKKGEYLANP